MLPGLLMTVGSFDISPKGYGVIREHALHFIKHLMAHVSWTTIRLNFDVVSEYLEIFICNIENSINF